MLMRPIHKIVLKMVFQKLVIKYKERKKGGGIMEIRVGGKRR